MLKVPKMTTKAITVAAVLVALAIILKSFISIETGSFRFTFYEIPMVFIGVLFGPIIGGILGFVVDFVHILFSPWAYTFNVYTISNMVWAIIPALFFFKKDMTRKKLIIALVITFIVTFTLNSIGIRQYEGMGNLLATLPYRLLVMVVKIPLDVYLIELLHQRVIVHQLVFEEAN